MNSGPYYKLINYPKEILVKYLIENFEEEIDLKKIDSLNWDRTGERVESQIDYMKRTIDKLSEKDEINSKKYEKMERRLKQKEYLLKWVNKKKAEKEGFN